jgi:peptide/nickel transport system substrate-binding protein
VVDDLTVTINYSATNPVWMDGFTNVRAIYPKHILEQEGAHDQFLTNPIGTGPYKVESFTPNDQMSLVINENYREPNKPFFSTVNIKGGGDAAAAARAVLQTGEYDFAWNLQVEPSVLEEMSANENAKGVLVEYPGVNIERINYNFSDPNTEVDGQRSEVNTPHPFLTDPAVREAMNIASDRETIANQFYGFGQPAAVNIIYGDPAVESPNTSWEFNPERAAQLLEDAGWVMDGDVRAKDGVELRVTYATSVNPVRQQTQAVIKSNFEKIGIGVELAQIDSGVYFDGSPGNEQNINHFYWDMDMYTNSPSSPVPVSFLTSWYAGPDGSNIAQKSNGWGGQNYQRWSNADFDAKFEELQVTTDIDAASALLIELNDIVIGDRAVVPLVNRSVDTYAYSNDLRAENLELGPFHDLTYWNIANWNFADGVEA